MQRTDHVSLHYSIIIITHKALVWSIFSIATILVEINSYMYTIVDPMRNNYNPVSAGSILYIYIPL